MTPNDVSYVVIRFLKIASAKLLWQKKNIREDKITKTLEIIWSNVRFLGPKTFRLH